LATAREDIVLLVASDVFAANKEEEWELSKENEEEEAECRTELTPNEFIEPSYWNRLILDSGMMPSKKRKIMNGVESTDMMEWVHMVRKGHVYFRPQPGIRSSLWA
jgi:hypothetical protein